MRERLATWARRLAMGTLALIASLLLGAGVLIGWLQSAPAPPSALTVHDFTELVKIDVDMVAHPTSAQAVQALVRAHRGPISIGGSRYSQGGQVATDDTLMLDLDDLDELLAFDPEAKRITVEAGITWREIIERIDAHDLSVQIMQSYANFSVGGSLSVNAHGRYVDLGPVVHSVLSIDLVLADGSLVHADRNDHADLFHGAIGGYGALGVIVAVELQLTDNEPLERTASMHPVEDFAAVVDAVQASGTAVMFNADLYPPDYDRFVAITFSRTDRPVTETARIQAPGGSSRAEQLMYWWVSESALGKATREHLIDPMRLSAKPVVWRNHEATYDVASLDPGKGEDDVYVLQEYFLPVERFEAFVPRMRRVFAEHDVNVVNVSIRHAIADPDTRMTWAPTDTYAFVVYYKMGRDPDAWDHARTWTQAMIDEILAEGGTWYLPYQIHATPEQFAQGYPGADALAALKARVDPDYTFRNKLWDAYLPPPDDTARDDVQAQLQARPTWPRNEDQTFLTLPEWGIVYSADELGVFLEDHSASDYPFFADVGQFWTGYRAVWARTRDAYPFNRGYHMMIGVIGVSFTVEYVGKGLYEQTLGALFGLGADRTPEEDAYAAITRDYGAFLHHTPWYAYDFDTARAQLAAAGADAPMTLRRWERRFVLGTELWLKSLWASVIHSGRDAAYEPEAEQVEVWLAPGVDPTGVAGLKVLEDLGAAGTLVAVGRYEPFTATVVELAERGADLVQVAAGERMMIQLEVDADWDGADAVGPVIHRWPILARPDRHRITVDVPVRRLGGVLRSLDDPAVRLERLYDY